MLTLQLNLENEHLLSNKIEDIISNLSEENQQLLIEKVLYNYLTDSVDYAKENYITEKIAEVRKNGLKNNYSYGNLSITVDEATRMTDEQIRKNSRFIEVIKEYKSPKESIFDKIHKLLEDNLKIETTKFVNQNNELKEIINNQQEIITKKFPEIVTTIMSNIAFGFILNTVKQAEMGQNTNYAIDSLRNILLNKNIL